MVANTSSSNASHISFSLAPALGESRLSSVLSEPEVLKTHQVVGCIPMRENETQADMAKEASASSALLAIARGAKPAISPVAAASQTVFKSFALPGTAPAINSSAAAATQLKTNPFRLPDPAVASPVAANEIKFSMPGLLTLQ